MVASLVSSFHLAIVPFKDTGHMNPMIVLAKQLVMLGVKITILFADPESLARAKREPGFDKIVEMRPLCNGEMDDESKAAALESALLEMKQSPSPPAAVLADIILSWTGDAIARAELPRYLLYTSGGTSLAFMLHLHGPPPMPSPPPQHHHQHHHHHRRPDNEDQRHGRGRPNGVEHPDRRHHKFQRHDWKQNVASSAGILLNSCYELESDEIDLIRGEIGDRVFPVGPLLDFDPEESQSRSPHSAVEQWLNAQPHASVVFVSFGSRTFLSADQIRELALGLEASEQRFLWALPSPPDQEPSLVDDALPEGFLDRAAATERILVLRGWAPQKSILAHPSLGGFVTHCGWNSVVEGICLSAHGAPMICWPFGADQPTNAKFLVDHAKVALRLGGESMGGGPPSQPSIVRRDEIQRLVRAIASEGREVAEMRRRMVAMRAATLAALKPGGSSECAVERFVQALQKSTVS